MRGPETKETKMSKTTCMRLAVLLAFAIVSVPMSVLAAEGSLSVGGHSGYLWRGQLYNDEAVLQPSFTASAECGLSFNAWGNINLTDNLGEDAKNEFNEVDLTVSYDIPIEAFSLGIAVAEYLFPHTTLVDDAGVGTAAPGTREVQITAGLDEVILAPSLLVAYDFDEADGFYASASISHSLDLADGLSLEGALAIAAASSDYNLYYFGVDDDALNDATATLTLSYEPMENVSVGAYVTYAKLLDSDIEDAADESGAMFNDGDIVVGGVTAEYSF